MHGLWDRASRYVDELCFGREGLIFRRLIGLALLLGVFMWLNHLSNHGSVVRVELVETPLGRHYGAGGFIADPHKGRPILADGMALFVERERQKLRKGRITFRIPSHFTLGESQAVEARINTSRSDDLYTFYGRGKPTVSPIQVATFMVLRLSSGKDLFTITPLTDDEEQAVPTDGVSRWMWNVEPKKEGRYLLTITASARVNIPGRGFRPIYREVFQQESVVIEPSLRRLRGLLEGNWQYLLTTILGTGVLTWTSGRVASWWKHRRREERNKKAGGSVRPAGKRSHRQR